MNKFDNKFEVWDRNGNSLEYENPAVARKAALDFKKEYLVGDTEVIFSPTSGKYWVRFSLAKRDNVE